MSTLQDSQKSLSMWADVEFNASLSAEFSDVINDDFLIVDGLHDDFSGFLDINAASMFNDDSKNDFSSSGDDEEKEEKTEVILEEAPAKKMVREARSRSPSPTPKRRRSVTHSQMDISPTPVKSTASLGQDSLDDLQNQYKRAVEQLAVSMRRSEMTRSEIICYRKAQETRAQLQQAQSRTFGCADGFLTGSQVTLTTGLAQSRQMLKNYMDLIKSPAF